jgi:type VI protein secretion system component Hcp
MEYKLTNAMVASFTPVGDSKGDYKLPRESIAFAYGQIDWTYIQQQQADGTGGGQVAKGWAAKRTSRDSPTGLNAMAAGRGGVLLRCPGVV